MEKIKIDELILVEGKYDKIKLSSFLDAVIVETGGFRIFKDKGKMAYIKKVAEKKGVVILTDGDSAGFQIRNFLKREMSYISVKNAYIPDILGKEKRKTIPSAEGKLGVEGIQRSIIEKALENSGVFGGRGSHGTLTKSRLYEDGFVGGDDSAAKRRSLSKKLGLPEQMSSNALLDAINIMLSQEEYERAIENIDEKTPSV